MNWYILFVRTGKEHKVEQLIKKQLNSNIYTPFLPLLEKIYKISGIVKKEITLLFPSYVFVESSLSNQEFIEGISTIIYNSCDILRLLRYSESEISIKESEKGELLRLCNDEYCIESSRGIIEGDKIYITDGPLKGRESIVKKVNRHKRQALIEMELMGEKRLVSVALELIGVC